MMAPSLFNKMGHCHIFKQTSVPVPWPECFLDLTSRFWSLGFMEVVLYVYLMPTAHCELQQCIMEVMSVP